MGQNRGAGNIERVHQGVKVTQILVLVWSAVMITVIHFTGPYLVRDFCGRLSDRRAERLHGLF